MKYVPGRIAFRFYSNGEEIEKKKQTIKNRNDYRTGLRYRRGWPEAVTGFFFFFFLLQRNIQRKRSDKVTQKRVGHRRKKGFFCLVFFWHLSMASGSNQSKRIADLGR